MFIIHYNKQTPNPTCYTECINHKPMLMLHKNAFALSWAIVWSVAVLLLALVAANSASGYGMEFVDLFGSVYKGYDATSGGAVVGAIWGFVDAFIGCWLFAWLYNHLSKKMK